METVRNFKFNVYVYVAYCIFVYIYISAYDIFNEICKYIRAVKSINCD